MSKFSHRSALKELLDRDDIPFEDIRTNMRELDLINTWLGGHRITLSGIRSLLDPAVPVKGPLKICEIGCGGGDNLKVIRKYLEGRGIMAEYTGIDLNPHCVAYAESLRENAGITFICSDYRDIAFERKPHILFSSLFCHHFDDEALKRQLHWMKENATMGFFVNDLHRHPVAYHAIRWLTGLFSRSYLVRHDAPLSVLRGFRRSEWIPLIQVLLPADISVKWKWAFRWLVVYRHGTKAI